MTASYERPGDEQLTHRDRKKLLAKRRINATALHIAEERPYDAITVESIAASAGVSESTVYRYFATKEGIFLWDEYDDAVIAEFGTLLAEHGPIDAMTMAADAVLSARFHLDRDRALSQLALIERVEPLKAAMTVRIDELRTTLAAMVAASGWPPLASHVFAGAVISAFGAAIELWVAGGGKESLTELFDEAIELLGAGFDSVR